MSYKGSYLRGEKWYFMSRDADGNLTAEIKKDLDKMKDINVYLDSKKEKEKPVETKSKKVK